MIEVSAFSCICVCMRTLYFLVSTERTRDSFTNKEFKT